MVIYLMCRSFPPAPLGCAHPDPNMMPTMRVDKGAISFVMNGANIMCQGFTSKGGRIETPLEAGSAVVSFPDRVGYRIETSISDISYGIEISELRYILTYGIENVSLIVLDACCSLSPSMLDHERRDIMKQHFNYKRGIMENPLEAGSAMLSLNNCRISC